MFAEFELHPFQRGCVAFPIAGADYFKTGDVLKICDLGALVVAWTLADIGSGVNLSASSPPASRVVAVVRWSHADVLPRASMW